MKTLLRIGILLAAVAGTCPADLWDLAQRYSNTHRFSTILTAQDVRDRLATDEQVAAAIDWCRKTAVTKVYLETFRDAYQAERGALERVRDRFRAAGIEVSGCVTTTRVGKPTTGWKPLSCYTDRSTQDKVKSIFEYTAALFDEIMIDDFWFTDCSCAECEQGRKARTVRMGDRSYKVEGDTWEDYRCELMVRLSRDHVLDAARRVNPKAKIIIKFPQWYDRFHDRGYEIVRQTRDFDRIWVGTETRDRDKDGVMPYEAYFIMRWLGAFGGPKTGGGWYDPFSTTPPTYLEQARQTVLGGARESVLFCYGGLHRATGPENLEALRPAIPELLEAARQVMRRKPAGIAAYKPPNSPAGNESFVFDSVGMLGLPLAPCHEFPDAAPAAFFSVHALKDARFAAKLDRYLRKGRPVLITDGLARRLEGKVNLERPNVQILPVNGKPKSLVDLPQEMLDRMRAPLLDPLKTSFKAPNEVGLYLFQDGSWVVENFAGRDARVELNGESFTVGPREWKLRWR